MTRLQLEHLIRAAGTISDDDDIIVIGSQAILGQFPDAPPELLVSREADVYPRMHPERAELIDGSIGRDRLLNECMAITHTELARRLRCCQMDGKTGWLLSRARIRDWFEDGV